MDEKTYRALVTKMRHHQNEWFRHHKPSDLHEARRLEKQVDQENRRWLDTPQDVRPTDEPMQVNLFTEADNETKRA